MNSAISSINSARGGVTFLYVRSRSGTNSAGPALSELVKLLSAAALLLRFDAPLVNEKSSCGRSVAELAVDFITKVNSKISSMNISLAALKKGHAARAVHSKALLYSSVHRGVMKPYFSSKIGSRIMSLRYCLTLNFRRIRFFPFLKREGKTPVFFNSSLGMLSNFFSSSKSFLRQKASYLLSAAFLRKVMLYLELKHLTLVIRGIPLYLQEILSTILTPSKKTYDHPLRSPQQVVDENTRPRRFGFEYVIFTSLKPHSVMKRKKKGRLKRKIAKKIVLLNNILD